MKDIMVNLQDLIQDEMKKKYGEDKILSLEDHGTHLLTH